MPSSFVDPRSSPDPRAGKQPPRVTRDPDQIAELQELCRAGQLYYVENWIRGGRPLQWKPGTHVRGRRRASVLQIGLDRGDHSLVHLLLCNGYDPNAEEESPLDRALESRRIDLLDLLLAWGADPHRVSRAAVFETYSTELMERFRSLGVEMTDGHEMADVLAERTSNKPLFGFAKRHRDGDPKVQRELDMALAYHAGEGNQKGVMLCLWAGADPYTPVLDLRWPADDDEPCGLTAIWRACASGHADILERLNPDPSREDFDDLYRWADSTAVIDVLAKRTLPKNVGPVIAAHISRQRLPFPFSDRWPSVEPLRRLFDLGVRWTCGSKEEIAYARWSLLRTSDYSFVETLKLLTKGDHCSPEVLHELARTPAFQRKMVEAGFMRRPNEDPWKWERRRPTRAHEVITKCGLGKSKQKGSKGRPRASGSTPEPPLPRTVRIGHHRRNGREVQLTRRELFDHVWSTPMIQLAPEWGLSDQGLAKVCRRLKVPRPPRGYWAKKRAGHKPRRPKLPKLREGEAEEIVIRIPE
ncbi:MAG: hypothetical protein WEA09_02415 [Gemmatimonadota bacterium]